MKFRISKIEYQLPATSEDIEELNLNNGWDLGKIYAKTGISKRWISMPDETASDLALIAANKLINDNKELRDEIDLLILITQSPDYFLPTTACVLQNRIGLSTNCMAFDVNLGCSGFIYGLTIAGSLLDSGIAKKALILCADTYSKFISKQDRTCRPIFSDGAAAILVEETSVAQIGPFIFGTDGSGFDRLIVKNGGMRDFLNRKSSDATIEMNGSSVFLFTINEIPNAINNLLKKADLSIDDLDLIIFHQASKFVIDSLIDKLSLDPKKVYTNYQYIGNTVSASIPIALKDAYDQNILKNTHKIMLVGFGVGLSWGGVIMNWEMDL